MDPKTDKLIQQAGKFIQLGKLTNALEPYLKAHQLNPGDTTIVNTIGDLYARLGKEAQALLWYHKLADALRSQELFSNASAAYKKILKLAPENRGVMTALAELNEQQGLGAKASQQYRLIAADMVNKQEHEAAIGINARFALSNLHPTKTNCVWRARWNESGSWRRPARPTWKPRSSWAKRETNPKLWPPWTTCSASSPATRTW
jgi:tetratricopeptide (TPR) repeat protein